MKECKVICDRCRAEVMTGGYPSTPEKDGWRDIDIKLSQYDTKRLSVCPKCLKELGLINEDNSMKRSTEPTIQEKVFDLLVEIARIAGGNE